MQPIKIALIGAVFFSAAAQVAAADSVTLGTNNWAENVAVSNMWQQLLAEKNIDVELSEISKPLLFGGLASGDIDLFLEVWIPSDQTYVDRYSQDVELHETWYDDARDTLVVPSYVEGIDSVADLAEREEDFTYQGQPTIFGIGPGATISDETDAAIEQYSLPFRQLSSSETAMLAQLEEAYRRKEPIALTLWQPHWVFAKYDLKILDDPKGALVSGQQVKWLAEKGFDESHPGVAAMLDAWHMTPEQLSTLMLEIEKTGDPDQGAAQWIDDNRELVDGWLAADDDG